MKLWILLGVWVGCSSEKPPPSDPISDPLSWSVDEPGPYLTGYRSWEHSYPVSDALGERTIRLHMWYPTEEEGGPVGEYTVGTDPNVIADAEFAPPVHDRGYPVHVHSHGDLDLGSGSAFLSRHMSSHGWVSVAMDHTGNTLLDATADPQAANFVHRPLDVRAAIDALEDLDSLNGAADTQRVVLSGHSRGAYTTWAALGARYDLESVASMCASGDHLDGDVCTPEEEALFATDLSEPRVVAAIPLDGTIRRAWFGEDGETSVTGPILYFSPEDSEGSQRQFDELAAIDFRWVTIDGACHQSFANGGCSSLDTEEGFGFVRTLSLAFSRMVVLSDTSAHTTGLVSGDVGISDLVSIRRR